MKDIILAIVGILIGLIILAAGIYYLVKEKSDKESRKIYSIVSVIGAVITIGFIIRLILLAI